VCFKYLIAWFGMVVVGIANATIRQVAYARYVSELVGHQISTLAIAILVGLYTWALGGFLKLPSVSRVLAVSPHLHPPIVLSRMITLSNFAVEVKT